MHRRNTVLGALFSIALIAAVAWYGERTHWVRPHSPPAEPITSVITMPPLDPDPKIETNTDKDKARKEDIAIPSQNDTPRPDPPPDALTQPIEPPRPQTNIPDTARIPQSGPGDGIGSHPFDISQLDQMPVVKVQASPEYPYTLKQEGITGDVLVAFVVDANGDVRNAVAVRSSNGDFEDKACKAVSRWKFKPGRKGGRAVAVRMEVPIEFKLNP